SGTWKDNYPELVTSSAQVMERGDLYRAFAEADVQVGVYSTALFEGAASGLETIVAGLPGHDALAPLFGSGAARLAEDAEQLSALARDPRPPAADVAQSLFKPGAVANFQS